MQVAGIQNVSIGLASPRTKVVSSAYYDPRDTNQDGVISAMEDLGYSFKHPEVANLKRLRSNNNTQEPPTARNFLLSPQVPKGTNRSIDLYA